MKADKKQAKEVSVNCNDPNCPFHGSLKLRGRTFSGTVTSAKMHRTIVIEWFRLFPLPKYERSEKRKTKIKAHLPDCIKVKEGDKITIKECRKLSKTKAFCVIKNESTQS